MDKMVSEEGTSIMGSHLISHQIQNGRGETTIVSNEATSSYIRVTKNSRQMMETQC
jgi:hypothetical protein